MGGSNPCKRCVCAGQDCLVHLSRWVIFYYTYYYFLIIFFFIADLLYMPGTSFSSSGVYPTPPPTPWPWSPLMAESWVLLKKHSRSLWRSTKKSESLSRTWWRARRGILPNWRGLGPWWSGDGAWKKRAGRKRMEVTRRGLRMALEKVRRRGLCCLPLVSILVLFFNRLFIIIIFIFCEINMWVRKARIEMKRSLRRNPEKCAEAEG